MNKQIEELKYELNYAKGLLRFLIDLLIIQSKLCLEMKEHTISPQADNVKAPEKEKKYITMEEFCSKHKDCPFYQDSLVYKDAVQGMVKSVFGDKK